MTVDLTQFFQVVSTLLVAAIIALTTWLLRVNVRLTLMEKTIGENTEKLAQHHARLHEFANSIVRGDGQLTLINERLQHLLEEVRGIKQEMKR